MEWILSVFFALYVNYLKIFLEKFFFVGVWCRHSRPRQAGQGGVAATDRQPATAGLSTDFGQPYPQIPVHK